MADDEIERFIPEPLQITELMAARHAEVAALVRAYRTLMAQGVMPSPDGVGEESGRAMRYADALQHPTNCRCSECRALFGTA